VIPAGGKRLGIEIKYADAPGLTKSMRIARQDLSLHRLLVVYPGKQSYDLDETARVIPVDRLTAELTSWRRRSRPRPQLHKSPVAK
jgi:hypothetical protein